MERFRSLQYPPVVFWEVTDQCNHNCIHCFNYWRTDKDTPASSCSKTAEDYLAIARKILAQKPVRVVLTGGEPLLAFEALKPTLLLLRQHKINVSFNTNAALLTEEIASFFAQNRIGMFISFPSCKEAEFDEIVDTPGAFGRVKAALELVKAHGLFHSFNMVVSRVNLHAVYDTIQYLKRHYEIQKMSVTRVSVPINAIDRFDRYFLSADELQEYMTQCVRAKQDFGVDITAASPITPCSITSEDAYELFALENSCEAGKTSYVIGSSGKVRACARDFAEYGDFMEEPFETIWARMDDWRDFRYVPQECRDCALKSGCRGGCRIDGIIKTGERNCLDSYSDVTRLPIRFSKQPPYAMPWDYTTEFEVPGGVETVDEGFAVRLSYKGGFTYCTKSFTDYLLSTPAFSLDEFCTHFDQPIDTAKDVLRALYKNGIVQVKR